MQKNIKKSGIEIAAELVTLVNTHRKMDLQTRKLSFIQEFLRIQNEDIISGLEKMLDKHKAKLYEENLKPMSMEQFNEDIDQSLEDSARERVVSTKDLKEEVKKWS